MPNFFLGNAALLDSQRSPITEDLFSTVVLGNSNAVTLGSDREAQFSDALSYLGVNGIRWPGGTEAERDFDWRTNASTTHSLDVSDLQYAIDYCVANQLSLSFTFPTTDFSGMTESEIDSQSDQIKQFIMSDLLGYAASKGLSLDSIKIGNEYDVNDLTAKEYGSIASQLTKIIGEAIEEFSVSHSNVDVPKIVVESGRIWLQGSDNFFGDTDHNGLIDAQEIMMEFNPSEAQYVDAIDIHSITLFVSSYADYFGNSPYANATLNSIYDSLDTFWEPTFGEVELYSLAWQYPWMRDIDGPSGPGGVEDHGGAALSNASLGFMQIFEMSLAGVAYAANWSASGWGGASPTLYKNTPRAGGEIFKLMDDNLVGLQAVEFVNDPTVFRNDAATTDVVFRAFETNGKVVLYVGNLEGQAQTITLDGLLEFLESIDGFEDISSLDNQSMLYIGGTKLGVEGDPTDYTSPATLEFLGHESLLSSTDSTTTVEIALDAYEILQIVISSDEGVFIDGRDTNDSLYGSAWDDTIQGEGGDDIIFSGAGSDLIDGGYGEDTINYDLSFSEVAVEDLGKAGVKIISSSGVDIVVNAEIFVFSDTTFTIDELRSFSRPSIEGSSVSDVLSGDNEGNAISGNRGADLLFGKAGDDAIFGNSGADEIWGGSGSDVIYGGWGSDQIFGEEGNDELFGEQHNDFLYGNAGDDILSGGGGDDILSGGTGSNVLTGGTGADEFIFDTASSTNVIMDFEVGIDNVNLRDLTSSAEFLSLSLNGMDVHRIRCLADLADDYLSVRFVQNGSDTEVYLDYTKDLSAAPLIVLEGIDMTTLSFDDFSY